LALEFPVEPVLYQYFFCVVPEVATEITTIKLKMKWLFSWHQGLDFK
jgi:hypothetical protein